HQLAVIVETHRVDRADFDHTSVVHDDVDPAEVFVRRVDKPLHVVAICDIADHRNDLTKRGEVLGGASELVFAARADHDAATVAEKLARDDESEAAGGAGDDGDFTSERVLVSAADESAGRE